MCFYINNTATTEIYTLSLHDALPIGPAVRAPRDPRPGRPARSRATSRPRRRRRQTPCGRRSEEHTSELQLRQYLVCRPLFDKYTNPPYSNVLSPRFSSPFTFSSFTTF